MEWIGRCYCVYTAVVRGGWRKGEEKGSLCNVRYSTKALPRNYGPLLGRSPLPGVSISHLASRAGLRSVPASASFEVPERERERERARERERLVISGRESQSACPRLHSTELPSHACASVRHQNFRKNHAQSLS